MASVAFAGFAYDFHIGLGADQGLNALAKQRVIVR